MGLIEEGRTDIDRVAAVTQVDIDDGGGGLVKDDGSRGGDG